MNVSLIKTLSVLCLMYLMNIPYVHSQVSIGINDPLKGTTFYTDCQYRIKYTITKHKYAYHGVYDAIAEKWQQCNGDPIEMEYDYLTPQSGSANVNPNTVLVVEDTSTSGLSYSYGNCWTNVSISDPSQGSVFETGGVKVYLLNQATGSVQYLYRGNSSTNEYFETIYSYNFYPEKAVSMQATIPILNLQLEKRCPPAYVWEPESDGDPGLPNGCTSSSDCSGIQFNCNNGNCSITFNGGGTNFNDDNENDCNVTPTISIDN